MSVVLELHALIVPSAKIFMYRVGNKYCLKDRTMGWEMNNNMDIDRLAIEI